MFSSFILSGVLGALVAGIGVFIGGAVISRWNLNLPSVGLLIFIATSLGAGLLTGMTFIGCEQDPVKGLNVSDM